MAVIFYPPRPTDLAVSDLWRALYGYAPDPENLPFRVCGSVTKALHLPHQNAVVPVSALAAEEERFPSLVMAWDVLDLWPGRDTTDLLYRTYGRSDVVAPMTILVPVHPTDETSAAMRDMEATGQIPESKDVMMVRLSHKAAATCALMDAPCTQPRRLYTCRDEHDIESYVAVQDPTMLPDLYKVLFAQAGPYDEFTRVVSSVGRLLKWRHQGPPPLKFGEGDIAVS